jgi:hypothetical protein
MLLRLLILLYLVGIWIAVVASIIAIESIVMSGPLLSVLGLTIAVTAFATGQRESIWLGVAVPSISVCCFALIFGLAWSPGDAERVIPALLFLFGTVVLPAGLHALRAGRIDRTKPATARFQFRLSSLIVLTTACAVPLAMTRLGPAPAAIGVIISYTITLTMVARSLRAARQPAELEEYRPLPSSEA